MGSLELRKDRKLFGTLLSVGSSKNIHTLSVAPALPPADHIKIILNGHHLYKEMEDRFDERLPCAVKGLQQLG